MNSWIWIFLLSVVTFIVIKAYRIRHHFEKWGIPQYPDLPFLGFMASNFFPRLHLHNVVRDMYNWNREAKYIGCHMFTSPQLMLRDLDLIKAVTVKNFDHFSDHKTFVDESMDPLFAGSLAMLNGDKWCEVRNVLNPAFTLSKMRVMFGLMSNCAENFVDKFLVLYSNCDEVEIMEPINRYTNDVIASCAFGFDIDSLGNPDNEFYIRGRSLMSSLKYLKVFKILFIRACPRISQILKLKIISEQDNDFFVNVIRSGIETRREQGITRPDMLQLMMDVEPSLNLLEMTAQAFVFFLAGIESTAVQMCVIAHELAANPDVQKKLHDEIDTVLRECDNKPTYEAMNNMVYLDAIFTESLRMHSASFMNRMCTKEFELPPAVPDAKLYIVQPGEERLISMPGIHYDPDYYENSERFDPDRHTGKRAAQGDATNLGFRLGPRMCIGNRFAVLETKVMFAHLLSKCRLQPCKKTCIPLKYDPGSLAVVPKGGFWLKVLPRN
ncbi:cytochrome P450 9e2 [Nasonia vitripennis]|uniref:Cytochrome P450 n=1 Tax=Nasonia vitripennis TaxID=7425 RepID=A0A7M7GF00_NASVI|nr:cytochrome P450 9e2 [Nasonia vitripennis]